MLGRDTGRTFAWMTGTGTASLLPSTRLGGPMPWVIAIMVALTVLAVGGALALTNFAAQTRAGLEGGLTVQIVAGDAQSREAQRDAAVAALRRAPAVDAINVVSDSELAELVEPWLGEANGSDLLIMPVLIEVRLADTASAGAVDRLRDDIVRAAPSARLDRQAEWLGPVLDAIGALRWLAAGLVVVLTLASAAAVWLAARNALDANNDTIEIVHHLGGNDAQIAGIFQRSVLIDAMLGGVVGLACGIGALALLGARFAALQSGMIESGSLSAFDWLVIALVPVATTGVALFTARRTVMARLGRML